MKISTRELDKLTELVDLLITNEFSIVSLTTNDKNNTIIYYISSNLIIPNYGNFGIIKDNIDKLDCNKILSNKDFKIELKLWDSL